ncbi:MAG: hemolysin family protein [Acidimicrobiales bacterium]
MSLLITALAITVMLALNALYVAAEFATVGSRKSRIQALAQDGNRPAAKLLAIVRDPVLLDNYVAACQIGITLSSLIAGAFGQARLTPLFEPLFGSAGRVVAIVITLLIITSLQVILGELLPKTAALRYPERLAIATLRPMQISQTLFRPLVKIFNGSAFSIMRALGLNTDHSHAHVHSPEELAALFDESAAGGLIDAAERDMVAGVLNVEQRLVREIMTPKRRLVGVNADSTVGEALGRVVETPHSRFPVWGHSTDDVTGVVHLRVLYLGSQSDPSVTVASMTRPMIEVPETLSVPALWGRLNESGQHCALVINEYGGVAGLVTLEDAMEEIFGEVRDEFDIDPDPIVVANGRVSVSGEVLVEDLNHRFDLSLPTEDVDTIGGLIWHELSRMPTVGERVALGPESTMVQVDAIDGNAVERVSFNEAGDAQ